MSRTGVCSGQVDAHTTRSSGQKVDKVVRVGCIELVHVLLPFCLLYITVESEVLDAFTDKEVFNCVLSAGRIWVAAFKGHLTRGAVLQLRAILNCSSASRDQRTFAFD
jgi:hypothetical protein